MTTTPDPEFIANDTVTHAVLRTVELAAPILHHINTGDLATAVSIAAEARELFDGLDEDDLYGVTINLAYAVVVLTQRIEAAE
jgi:hypothetical protein